MPTKLEHRHAGKRAGVSSVTVFLPQLWKQAAENGRSAQQF